MEINLPNLELRPYQQPLWNYLVAGGKRAVQVWPRRAGKDSVSLAWASYAAHRRIGNFVHLFPEAKLARKALWEGITKDGERHLDRAFPLEIRESQRDDEMLLRLKCGSTWQLAGSDQYNSLIGTNFVGVVFSEWAVANPHAWTFIRPILAENDGWAIFPYTPRGMNHGYDLYEMARASDAWFAELLTVDDTHHMTDAALAQERQEMDAQIFAQEYYCSFQAGQAGSFYGAEMAAAAEQDRITQVPADPALPVHTAFDLGIHDATAIWFFQVHASQVRVIDYYENQGEALAHYVQVLSERGYNYGTHFLPHDCEVRELGSGISRREVLQQLGLTPYVLKAFPVYDGIQAVRSLLPRCWFDTVKCADGIGALRAYRKELDEIRNVYKPRPVHDWASHGADAFRYMAHGIAIGPMDSMIGSVFNQQLAQAVQ